MRKFQSVWVLRISKSGPYGPVINLYASLEKAMLAGDNSLHGRLRWSGMRKGSFEGRYASDDKQEQEYTYVIHKERIRR